MAVVLSKKELSEFREYVSDFYLENHGLYGKYVKATWAEIDGAIDQHLKDVKDFKGDRKRLQKELRDVEEDSDG